MTAKEAKLSKFLDQQKTRFVIPIYQRNYDWTSQQVDGLLKDIATLGENKREDATHFIGSIVFLHDGIHHTGAISELEIIDGQQRLTTVSLIYARLYEIARESGKDEEAAELRELFLVNRFAKDRKEKLILPSNNAPKFKQIIEGTLPVDRTDEFSRVRENFESLRQRISVVDAQNIRRGLDRLIFVEISLERGKDDPQRIFESLNSTGLELSQADLIRNHVLIGFDREAQERLFHEFWEPIERATRENSTNQTRLSDFVRDFLTMEQRKITRQSEVYLGFRRYLSERIEKGETTQQVLFRLRSHAENYGLLLNPESAHDVDLQEELSEIKSLEIRTATPFLLRVLEDYRSEKIERIQLHEMLRLIQTYVWRRFVVGAATNTLNKTFATLYDSYNAEEYVDGFARHLMSRKGSARFPSDREFRTALRDRDLYPIRAKNRAYMFRQIEAFNNNERVDLTQLTIEHIFPQNPAEAWRRDLDSEEYHRFKSIYLHRIGNLTLSGNNGKLGNKSFREKRDMNEGGGEQGYHFSRLYLNRDLRDAESWDERAFQQRTERLVERMLDIWPTPKVVEELEVPIGYESLEDIESATNQKIIDAKVFGLSTGEVAFADFYRRVLREFYEKDAYRMRDQEIMGVLNAKMNPEGFLRAYEVAPGYFVETHSASDTKLRVLQVLVSHLELEGEIELSLVEI